MRCYRIESLLLIVIFWVSPSSQSCPEPVDGRGAPLWVLREPPVGSPSSSAISVQAPGTCAATLLVGAGKVVLVGHDRQCWPGGGSLEIAA